MSSYTSGNSLQDQITYQEVILTNSFDKVIEDEFRSYNKVNKLIKKTAGYFYNTINKNIYLNELTINNEDYNYCRTRLINYNSYENKLRFKSAAYIKKWLPIYEHTKFLIQDSHSSVWFSFQFLPREQKYLQRTFAIISAGNPGMQKRSDSLNDQNNKEIETLLKESNYTFYTSIGELSGYVENSFIIYDISRDDAIKLGQKFQQESILYNDAQRVSILNCKTNNVEIDLNHKKYYH